nr:reverse transcriptase domain-containing protein [Tanacetum cinerariifolium]
MKTCVPLIILVKLLIPPFASSLRFFLARIIILWDDLPLWCKRVQHWARGEPIRAIQRVSPRLVCSGLKVYHLPPASSVHEDAYSTKACSGFSMQYRVSWGPLQISHRVVIFFIWDIVMEFCGPSRWKELSKESGSKIASLGERPGEALVLLWIQGSPPVARKRTPRSIHTWEDLVSKFINEFFPPSRTTNLRNEISNFQQRFNESFHEAWDRYKELLRACPHNGFNELHQLDTFYNALNPADQDSLNAAAGGNLLERCTQDVLTIIENKSKGNSVYRPPGMANQIRPPGFALPNVQNNQNRFGQPQGFNCGNNFKPEQSYQASTQQNQNVPLNELEKVKRMNEANMKAMQTQINIVKNKSLFHQRSPSPLHANPLSGSTTYSSSSLLEELADELALITFPSKYDDDLQLDVESDLKEIEFLLHRDMDSSLKDSIDQKVESDIENVYDDPFESKGEKFKESKLLINELDLPCHFLRSEYDSFTSKDFSRVDAKPSTNNEDKVFNPGILSQENPFEIITRVVQDKKLATSNASLLLEDFDPPLYEPLFFKEVPRSKMLLLFSSENKEKFSNQEFTLLKKFILLLSHNYLIKAIKFSTSTKFSKA